MSSFMLHEKKFTLYYFFQSAESIVNKGFYRIAYLMKYDCINKFYSCLHCFYLTILARKIGKNIFYKKASLPLI